MKMEEVIKRVNICIKQKNTFLDLSNLNLTELPSTLPSNLQTLYCSNNNLTELPSTLNSSLERIYCSYNSLTKIHSWALANSITRRTTGSRNKIPPVSVARIKLRKGFIGVSF